jgi:hypothetical protein
MRGSTGQFKLDHQGFSYFSTPVRLKAEEQLVARPARRAHLGKP